VKSRFVASNLKDGATFRQNQHYFPKRKSAFSKGRNLPRCKATHREPAAFYPPISFAAYKFKFVTLQHAFLPQNIFSWLIVRNFTFCNCQSCRLGASSRTQHKPKETCNTHVELRSGKITRWMLFFTLVTFGRHKFLTSELARLILRQVWKKVQRKHPFNVEPLALHLEFAGRRWWLSQTMAVNQRDVFQALPESRRNWRRTKSIPAKKTWSGGVAKALLGAYHSGWQWLCNAFWLYPFQSGKTWLRWQPTRVEMVKLSSLFRIRLLPGWLGFRTTGHF